MWVGWRSWHGAWMNRVLPSATFWRTGLPMRITCSQLWGLAKCLTSTWSLHRPGGMRLKQLLEGLELCWTRRLRGHWLASTYQPRIITASFKSNPNLTVIVSYTPTHVSEDSKKKAYYDKLRETMEKVPEHNFLMTLMTSMLVWGQATLALLMVRKPLMGPNYWSLWKTPCSPLTRCLRREQPRAGHGSHPTTSSIILISFKLTRSGGTELDP